jgi:Na+-translocating ferredoxin:NAD+ oxidoreductase subunit D
MSGTAGLAGQGKNGQSGESPLLLSVSMPPHLRGNWSVPRIMLFTVAALVPALVVSIINSGIHVLFAAVLCTGTAAAADWVLCSLKERKYVMIDGSACVTGLLFAFTLQPHIPLWMAFVGPVFAVTIVKAAFGGLGRNFLNPALAGRAFCALSFPALFGAASAPAGNACGGFMAGFPEPWFAGALLAGAIALLSLRIIDFTLPLAFIGSVFVLCWFTEAHNGLFTVAAISPALFKVCSGTFLLFAFFMATEPVTSPAAPAGRFLFGAGCGVLVFLFRASNDGIIYAVLVMNCIVPYIDRYCCRGLYGLLKRSKVKSA